MKTKFSPREIIIPTLVLLIIGVVAAALLGGTNALTKDKIASIDAEAKAKAMSIVMPEAQSFGDEVQAAEKLAYSTALNANGDVIGYAFTSSVSGYGGEIKVMAGIGTDGCITQITILAADSETPGLGQNVKKDNFLHQFIGKSSLLKVVKNAVSGGDEIQAVTSATISSTAVTNAVNTALDYFRNHLQEGGNGNG